MLERNFIPNSRSIKRLRNKFSFVHWFSYATWSGLSWFSSWLHCGVRWLKLNAAQNWADEPITKAKAIEYHGFVAIQFTKPSGNVIVSIKTGHYYKKTRLYRYTYDPLGSLVDRKIYWSYVFRYFHEAGWIDNSFGVWFADITAIALVLFGASGLILFIVPRQKKLKRNLSALLQRWCFHLTAKHR